MTVSSLQRPFTAELRKRRDLSSVSPAPDLPAPSSEFALWQCEVMEALGDVRQRLAALTPAQTPTTPATARTAGEIVARPLEDAKPAEVVALKRELQALEHAIADTKREIAALRQLGKPPASLATATNELDAVVQATEGATECILAASERIDELVSRLRNQAADADERAVIEEIGEHVTHIFESCNFQDITGQRINKVVGAMKFIEERVERMIEILGGSSAFAGLEPVASSPPEHPASDEAHLLCGPQLEGAEKISQDDIDAFFD